MNSNIVNKDKNLHQLSMLDNQNKQDIYNDWADSYDNYVKEYEYIGPRELINKITPFLNKNDLKILDFGCGTGLVGIELNECLKKNTI